MQEILVEDDIRLKCVQPLEEKISERDYVYTFYAYEPGTGKQRARCIYYL